MHYIPCRGSIRLYVHRRQARRLRDRCRDRSGRLPYPIIRTTPMPPAISAIPALSPEDEWYYENYSWEYNNVQWNFHLQISRSIYEFYKGSSHDRTSNYADYAMTAEDKDFLDDVMMKFKNNSAAGGFTNYDKVMNVLTFVQSIPYEEDADGTEYTRYPIETLVDEKGDSKDKSILAAAMLNEMGYDVVLLKYPDTHGGGRQG